MSLVSYHDTNVSLVHQFTMATNPKRFNLIFCAQGSALRIFDNLLPPLNQILPLGQIGLYVADQVFFDHHLAGSHNFSNLPVSWLKEWEINQQAAHLQIDHTKLQTYDELYGQPNLWPALIADRRIFLGPLTKYKQDYAPRLSYLQMLQRLQASIEHIEHFISQVKPQVIIGFNMVTLDEFIFFLVAKQKGIPYLQIKNAKINNLITLFPDPLHIANYLASHNQSSVSASSLKQARQYLQRAQARSSTYEGHIILKPPSLTSLFSTTIVSKIIKSTIFSLLKSARYPTDNQSSGLAAVWQFNVVKPINAIKHHRYLSRHYMSPHHLPTTSYVFFPLHTEPEIALSIYGRYHQNQIEVIRNIAQSLPVTWSVVVKDHPRSLGFRTLKYYKKLLQIPNVKLVNPFLSSWDVIEYAKAVVTISSWVGFEAVIAKKPVVTLGECTYNCLPDSMVVKNTSYSQLSADISRAINEHHYHETALLNHIATVISLSFPINMYSDVLAKPNRHVDASAPQSKQELWSSFARYVASAIDSPQ
jgi:hypothetical protein